MKIELMSHSDPNIVSDSVDLTIALRSTEASSMKGSLHLLRFSGDEEVPRAVQVLKLQDIFIVRAKLPFARSRYELRFYVSSVREPSVLEKHTLKYWITTTETCQTLLSSFEDPLLQKFGLCQTPRVAQLDGASVIAPSTHRIVSGLCYFLVHIDVRAWEAVERRDQAIFGDADSEDDAVAEKGPAQATLLRKRQRGGRTVAAVRSDVGGRSEGAAGLVSDMQGQLSEALLPQENLQNAHGHIHLDVSVKNGNCQIRLSQRPDFPELHEGLIAFGAHDEGTMVELFLRFPQVHAAGYSPRKLAEWVVCRDEQFPISF